MCTNSITVAINAVRIFVFYLQCICIGCFVFIVAILLVCLTVGVATVIDPARGIAVSTAVYHFTILEHE